MKTRKKSYGDANMVGKNIERLRKEKGIKQKDFIAKIQVMGGDMNPTSYSKLEGQIRSATDKEIYVISKILNVSMEKLFESEMIEKLPNPLQNRRVLRHCLKNGQGDKGAKKELSHFFNVVNIVKRGKCCNDFAMRFVFFKLFRADGNGHRVYT